MGDLGLITGLGRSPGEGKGYPLQYSGLENSIDCIVHRSQKLDTTEWLSFFTIYVCVCVFVSVCVHTSFLQYFHHTVCYILRAYLSYNWMYLLVFLLCLFQIKDNTCHLAPWYSCCQWRQARSVFVVTDSRSAGVLMRLRGKWLHCPHIAHEGQAKVVKQWSERGRSCRYQVPHDGMFLASGTRVLGPRYAGVGVLLKTVFYCFSVLLKKRVFMTSSIPGCADGCSTKIHFWVYTQMVKSRVSTRCLYKHVQYLPLPKVGYTQGSSTDECINKIWYIHTMEFYSSLKRRFWHVTTWINSESIMLS